MKRYCRKKTPLTDIFIGIILVGGGILLVLFYIPIWAWMTLFGLFLVGLGVLILLGRR